MVKDLIIKPIDSVSAKAVVKKYHYSGKTTQNSQIHFGVFLRGKLEGVMQFGPSIDKRRMAQKYKTSQSVIYRIKTYRSYKDE